MLEGTVPPSWNGRTVFLYYYPYNGAISQREDSCRVAGGRFRLRADLSEAVPGFVRVRGNGANGQRTTLIDTSFLLQPGPLRLRGNGNSGGLRISGGQGHAEYAFLKKLRDSFNQASNPVATRQSKAHALRDTATAQALLSELARLRAAHRARLLRFAEHHPGSLATLLAAGEFVSTTGNASPAQLQVFWEALPKDVMEAPSALKVGRALEAAAATTLGRPAPDFTQPDTLGLPVSLASFRGRWVLLQFWASWCKGCRLESPALVQAWKAYRDQNFTILSVSLDRPGQKDRWLAAIRQDGLNWNHVSDLRFWDNAVVKLYGIRAVPANILIDPQGRIVARNLEGPALGRKLAEVLR
ncbi:TlpA disulfide reductase family protein [Flaviaesturariibacter amylovorans]|uniref:Thioredoxin domain-containing protein n=1 Tax=Flaviaesturariibacter amylovorans TaxID=1084520 RepID=A0ABP8H991_9BACT